MNFHLWFLFVVIIAIFILIYIIYKKTPKAQIRTFFIITLILLLELCSSVFLQGVFSEPLGIDPIYFDYFSYIGACFIPVVIYFVSLIFSNTKITFKKRYLLLFVIPIITLIVIWTNDFHHLFYKKYSINLNETITGPYANIYLVYTYSILLIAMVKLLRYSMKNSGFFSKQSLLFLIGTVLPISINLLGSFAIIPMTIYITPISFAFAIFFYALAIFKFGFLSITPIALQRIVDRMSDGYLVVNDENIIIDFNKTLLDMFNFKPNNIRNKNIDNLISDKYFNMDLSDIKKCIDEIHNSDKTYYFEKELKNKQKYFNIEINSIKNDTTFLGTLILFKDTTQHMLDMQTIKDNQDMLMEGERLASLGQLIGGIAHNLKTPIMSIAGASEGLSDLVKEYDESIENPNVNYEDHHAIAKDMTSWINKIKEYTEYMSDIITAVKGQAVTLSEKENGSFDLEELIKRVDILMKHELKNAIIYLNVRMHVDSKLTIKGDVNSLVQVINNMISNSIQAYNGKTGEYIILDFSQQGNNLIIAIQDNASGLPKNVKNKLFKEMVTTKGKNGTGLGLYMSYSTIKAHFNGNINFETEEGKGTTFFITLPIQ